MSVLSDELLGTLHNIGLDPDAVLAVVRCALAEDLRYGPDVTTDAIVPADSRTTADVVARSSGVIAGLPVAGAVLQVVGGGLHTVETHRTDGVQVQPGDWVVTISGPTRALLTAERTALNVLTHLSGVATLTRAWVNAVSGTGARIRDTRKTTPGLRLLEKYAVRCGGGVNHRLGLGDAALVKDNHVAAAGSITAAVSALRSSAPHVALEVECDTLDQVREALDAGVQLVLLDNMNLDQLRTAVELARTVEGVRLEASGGLSLATARQVAETGVDYLAVGALTHSAPALDLALDVRIPRVDQAD